MAAVVFRVAGVPQPQGNKTCFCKNGRGVIVEGRRGLARKAFKQWRAAVSDAAGRFAPVSGAVLVTLIFQFERPAGHWTKSGQLRKGAPEFPSVRPDIDKLTRAVLDGITEGKLIEDDARVVKLQAEKQYAYMPGVIVRIEAAAKRATLTLAALQAHFADTGLQEPE